MTHSFHEKMEARLEELLDVKNLSQMFELQKFYDDFDIEFILPLVCDMVINRVNVEPKHFADKRGYNFVEIRLSKRYGETLVGEDARSFLISLLFRIMFSKQGKSFDGFRKYRGVDGIVELIKKHGFSKVKDEYKLFACIRFTPATDRDVCFYEAWWRFEEVSNA